jgi:hypothetical protein
MNKIVSSGAKFIGSSYRLKLLVAIVAICMCYSCNEDKKEIRETNQEKIAIEKNEKKLPSIIALTGNAKTSIEEWTEFTDFDAELRRLNDEEIDLATLYAELLRRQIELRESEFPEKYDTPAIRSRLLVLRTYLGKAQAGLLENDQQVITKDKEDIIKAYNAVRMQLMEVWKKNIAEEFLKNDSIL